MAPPTPTRFGKYELLTRLAKGGMAETFRAQLKGAAGVTKQVVIKRVLPELAEDEAFVTAFIDEARLSASLSHGNIAQVFDFGRVEGDYFIAMELVDGRSLAELLDRAAAKGFQRIPLPIACFLAIETLRGLHYAHTRLGEGGQPLNLVHRDVSPENVLVGFEGQIKVVDFGVAKAAQRGRTQTDPGLVKGKFLFFSPEQACGEPLDGRSDVFALGVVLYRMTCGVLPFEGQLHTVMRAIVEGRWRRAAVANPQLPSALAAVIDKAMATQRDQRWASALELHEALSSFLYRQEPTFSGEAVKEWMRWLFRPELEAERRDVSLSTRFLGQLQKWDPQGQAGPGAAPVLTREARTPPEERARGAGRRWALIAAALAVAVAGAAAAVFWRTAPPPVEAAPEAGAQGPIADEDAGSLAPAAQPTSSPGLAALEAPAAAPRPKLTAAERKERLAAARKALAQLDWPRAQELLESCYVGAAPCPEATVLLGQMARERDAKNAVLDAERALDVGDLLTAGRELGRTSGQSKLVAKRRKAVEKRWQAMTAAHAAANAPSTSPADTSQQLLREAKEELSHHGYKNARPLLERCIRLTPKNADCHKFLAAVWGKLNQPARQRRSYQEFLRLAPADHAERPAIQAIVDAAAPKKK